MSSANSDSFTCPFQIEFLLFFLSVAVAKIFTITLNKDGKSAYLCIVSDLVERLSAFHRWVWCWL